MPMYYVNTSPQPNGDHEVHQADCKHGALEEENKKYLGYFDNCHSAVAEAKRYYSTADGCYYCSYECHTS